MKVCVITTSRADWNSLGMVAKALKDQGADITVQTVGDHYALAEADGFEAWIEDNVADGHPHDNVPFDIAVLCGDRHETAIEAVHAIAAGVPIAHLAGGDVTKGSADDLFRSAISKMAHLHFPTNIDSANNLLQMGENADRIWWHGSASVDRIVETPIISLSTLRTKLGITQELPIILVNWQVPTAEDDPSAGLRAMLATLDATQCTLVFCGVNPENGSEDAEALIEEFIIDRSYAYGFKNLPGNEYISLMAQCEVMVGNSSSAYYEAPYLGTPTVDITPRQNGRLTPKGMYRVGPDAVNIAQAIEAVRRKDRAAFLSEPYGKPGAAVAIAKTILANPMKGIAK